MPVESRGHGPDAAGTQTALYSGTNLADTRHDPVVGQIARYSYDNGTHGGIQDGNSAWHCRSASRDHFGPSDPAFANGFRLACETE